MKQQMSAVDSYVLVVHRYCCQLTGKQYRPVPPGLNFSQRFDPLYLEELQRWGSPRRNEEETVEETAAYVEESLQEGLSMSLDYMETVSKNITLRLEAIERVNASVSEGCGLERLPEEREGLKRALCERIGARVSISAHMHFLRFCTWLKHQEETGSVEEQVFWERSRRDEGLQGKLKVSRGSHFWKVVRSGTMLT